ncbi:U6 snRNA-associated Sm-like protein LSm7 isoform X3 [Meriones unguiculatus]|uniref:U6 snRNA-associated Sm-like protein LSm7 isoform X3 n=1 Tax=Meriones unguiculatus TaxID=10047 RepID=UPI00293EB174|nr:U6 snRNA-associated Sm-like protein LSm7 isoform X3 [Meriones unguiculatus]
MAQDKEKKKKESILDLSKYIDKTIRVKFQGGREASGILKGFDPLLNLVLDGTIEYMRGVFCLCVRLSTGCQELTETRRGHGAPWSAAVTAGPDPVLWNSR